MVTACGAPDAQQTDQIAGTLVGTGVERIVDQAAIDGTLPLGALLQQVFLDEEQHFTAERAIQQCMESRGFEYDLVPYFAVNFTDTDRRYGITDEQAASVYGYQRPPKPGDEQRNKLEEELTVNAPNRAGIWETAFFGEDTVRIDLPDGGWIEYTAGGCLDVGRQAAVGDVAAWMELTERIQGLIGESYGGAENDPRVQEALTRWVSCMESAGYVVTSLEDAPYGQGEEAAVADARCNNASGLATTWMEVESEFQWLLLAEHQATLDALLDKTSLKATPDLAGAATASANTAELPVPPTVAAELADAPPEVHVIIRAVGAAAAFVQYWQMPGNESINLTFVLPNGDFLSVGVQAMTSVSRPRSFIEPGWVIGQLAGWDTARIPRDNANSYEGLWVFTEHYQFDVSLSAPPRQRLATPEGSVVIETVAYQIADALEEATDAGD